MLSAVTTDNGASTSNERGIIVCPRCSAHIKLGDRLCPQCGEDSRMPKRFRSTEPSTIVRNYRNAAQEPRPLVLVGVWLIFAPQAAALLFLLCAVVAKAVSSNEPSGSERLAGVGTGLLLLGLLTLVVTILWKATANHLRSRLPPCEPTGGFPVLQQPTSHSQP
jgi:hypothetical protein